MLRSDCMTFGGEPLSFEQNCDGPSLSSSVEHLVVTIDRQFVVSRCRCVETREGVGGGEGRGQTRL